VILLQLVETGYVCYAEAQIDIWKRLGEDVDKWFAKANSQYTQLMWV